jgi:predicted DNA-binding transcriptional regulator YafY
MKNKSKLLILSTIFNSVLSVSKTKLLEILNDNSIHISKRTLERYLKDLTDLFFIEFSKHHKGYVKSNLIDEKEASLYLQYLNVNLLSQNLITFSENNLKYQKYIVSENIVFKATNLIEIILDAFHSKKELYFFYYKQYTQREKRDVIPLFLKEYQKRWYLIALDKNRKNQLRTFGLDRMEDLKIGNPVEIKIDFEKYKHVFDSVLGLDLRPINPDFPNPVSITIKAIKQQAFYFKSLPFHQSQRIIEDTEEFTLFEYTLLLNFEFTQHYKMYAPFLEVVEPKWLREKLNINI